MDEWLHLAPGFGVVAENPDPRESVRNEKRRGMPRKNTETCFNDEVD